ncbi:MAG TPA: carboxypeptidase regulatory-like domain-containing protein, partial [Vicinamibacterales bacterium]|nr:carboxypeptidase regulatory-like domain-containing protein [Vicinamibacterales bacterium]
MTDRLIGPFVLALVLSLPAQIVPVISGTVTDDNGRPVQGAVVSAILMSAVPPSLAPVLSVSTDANGAYAIQSLPLGNYAFGVQTSTFAAPLPERLAGQAPAAAWRAAGVFSDRQFFAKVNGALPPGADGTSLYDAAFYGGATTAAAARLVQADPVRPKTGIDITLKAVRAVRVSGVVTMASTADGAAGGAEPWRIVVRLLPGGTSPAPRGVLQTTPPVASAIAASDNTFVFPLVPEGNYILDAYRAFPPPEVSVDAGGVPAISIPSRVDGDPLGLTAVRTLTVAGDVADVRIALRPSPLASREMMQLQTSSRGRSGGAGAGRGMLPPRIGGPRNDGAISGKLTDADGAPLGGVQIHVAVRFGTDIQPIGPAAITDADGTYRLGGITPGRYVVVVPAFAFSPSALNPTPNAFPPPTQVDGMKRGYVTTFYPAAVDSAQAEAIEITPQEHAAVD